MGIQDKDDATHEGDISTFVTFANYNVHIATRDALRAVHAELKRVPYRELGRTGRNLLQWLIKERKEATYPRVALSQAFYHDLDEARRELKANRCKAIIPFVVG